MSSVVAAVVLIPSWILNLHGAVYVLPREPLSWWKNNV